MRRALRIAVNVPVRATQCVRLKWKDNFLDTAANNIRDFVCIRVEIKPSTESKNKEKRKRNNASDCSVIHAVRTQTASRSNETKVQECVAQVTLG